MAKHRRQLIREAIQKALLGKTLAGERVFSNQSTSAWDEDLPVILIYPKTETAEEYATNPRELKKTVFVTLELIASGAEEFTKGEKPPEKQVVEDLLDQMALEVECELSRDDTLGAITIKDFGGNPKEVALADDLFYTSTEWEFNGEGAQAIGSARLVYAVVYYEKVPLSIDKIAGLGDFKKVEAEWKVGHDDSSPDNEVEASDSVDIPQT